MTKLKSLMVAAMGAAMGVSKTRYVKMSNQNVSDFTKHQRKFKAEWKNRPPRVLWDSSRRGTYERAKHGELK